MYPHPYRYWKERLMIARRQETSQMIVIFVSVQKLLDDIVVLVREKLQNKLSCL